jgi:hypothetical protein
LEKIMSKTNDTSKLDRVKIENRVLADSELDAVSGGWDSYEHVAIGLADCVNCEAAALAVLNALGRISGGGW